MQKKNNIEKFNELGIKNKIYSIRGFQVMLDSDLAELYGVKTKVLNKAVKRNIEKFPSEFMFQITETELNLRFQNGTSSWGGTRYLPYVFTESGVAMLAGVLKSEIAVKMSVQIIKAFIKMRKFINLNSQIFRRLDRVEVKQIETDHKFEQVFNALETQEDIPKQGIFFEGQIFDAYNFVSNLFKRAKESVMIIDNYIDNSVLIHLTEIKKDVKVKILTKSISEKLKLDIKKFEDQYFKIEVKVYKKAHDRFIIIDGKEVYHVGASLKDLGKKLFGFSKMDKSIIKLISFF